MQLQNPESIPSEPEPEPEPEPGPVIEPVALTTGALPVVFAEETAVLEENASLAVLELRQPAPQPEPTAANDLVALGFIDPAPLERPRDLQSGLARLWADRRCSVGGVPFVATTQAGAAADFVGAAAAGSPGEHVHLANAYSVALADKDSELATTVFGAPDGWNLPDGRPIGWISALRRDEPRLRQARGPQFFLDVLDAGRRVGLRHYLLGGTPEVLAALESALRDRFPGVDIVGAVSPPFRPPSADELAARDDAIVGSGAQVVWVGLGTPKQDFEVARIAASVPVVAVAIGAGFDFAAGTLRQAPHWMTVAGLEWLFRLAMEPRRLWRRYVFGNARFLLAVLRRGRR